MGKNNDDTFMTNPDEWYHMNILHDHEGEKIRHKDATVKSDAEAVGKWLKDPDNIGSALDPVVAVGAMYTCSQLALDYTEGHTDQEAVHAGECTADELMSVVAVGSGGLALPEAEVAMEEENATLMAAKSSLKAVKSIPKFMGPGGTLVVAATPAVIKLAIAKQKAEEAKQEAKQRALEKIKAIKAEQLRLQADIWEQAFEDQGVWDTDFRPQLVPAIAQSPQQEDDEPMLAHDVVAPTLEPDLQPMQSVSAPLSAPEPANLQTTGAALVLTGVVLYAAYSSYASA